MCARGWYFAHKTATNRNMKRKKKIDTEEAWSYKHDFPIEEVWSTHKVIARMIVPRLKTFRALDKHGYPESLGSTEAWNKALDKMIYAFELDMSPSGPTLEHEKDFKEGFDLFCRYYRNLWD